MAYDGYKLISFERDGKIVTGTVDAPPINIITLELYAELARMSQDVEADADCLVFVLKSANPDFFLAHFDVGAILEFPIDRPATREGTQNNDYSRHVQPHDHHGQGDHCLRSRAGSGAAVVSFRWASICASASWARPRSTRWRYRWASCRAALAPRSCPA